jgi:hypothetical protein
MNMARNVHNAAWKQNEIKECVMITILSSLLSTALVKEVETNSGVSE